MTPRISANLFGSPRTDHTSISSTTANQTLPLRTVGFVWTIGTSVSVLLTTSVLMALLLTHMAVGGKLVIDNRFACPQTIMEAMTKTRVTGFSGVPSTYAILSTKSDFLTRPLPHLRYFTQAGGGMAPSLTKRIQGAFANRAKLFIMYGQTEASARLSYVPPEKLTEKLGSIGVSIPGVQLSVVHSDNSVMEVDGVVEVCVVGQKDELLGEAIVAHVVIDDKQGDFSSKVPSEKDILSYLRKNLPLYIIPRELQFHESLPKNSSGKARKSDLV